MLTSVLCVCVVTNILHEGLHIVSFYLGCCTSNYNLPATLPRGEGMDFFDKLRSRPIRVGSGMDRIYLTARVLYFLVLFTNRTSMATAKTMPTTTAMG